MFSIVANESHGLAKDNGVLEGLTMIHDSSREQESYKSQNGNRTGRDQNMTLPAEKEPQ